MKNLYRVINKNGATLCFQVAADSAQALSFAKMYGASGARTAEFVRAD